MGTKKSGRYLSTKGSGRSVSDFALVHSNEGDLIQSQKRVNGKMTFILRLTNGGHGQKGMDLLDKYGIEYHIVKTYSNGVRVGYVPNHKKPNKRSGTGQSWFPRSWTARDIRRAGEHVANLKLNRKVKDGVAMFGVYKGVRVGVKRTKGNISTIFPDSDQSSVLKKRRR
jgi:hypothetical protein